MKAEGVVFQIALHKGPKHFNAHCSVAFQWLLMLPNKLRQSLWLFLQPQSGTLHT